MHYSRMTVIYTSIQRLLSASNSLAHRHRPVILDRVVTGQAGDINPALRSIAAIKDKCASFFADLGIGSLQVEDRDWRCDWYVFNMVNGGEALDGELSLCCLASLRSRINYTNRRRDNKPPDNSPVRCCPWRLILGIRG